MLLIIALYMIGIIAVYYGCKCSEAADNERRIKERIKAKKRFADMQNTEHHELGHQYIGTHYNSLEIGRASCRERVCHRV